MFLTGFCHGPIMSCWLNIINATPKNTIPQKVVIDVLCHLLPTK